jgi:hypothetical protein
VRRIRNARNHNRDLKPATVPSVAGPTDPAAPDLHCLSFASAMPALEKQGADAQHAPLGGWSLAATKGEARGCPGIGNWCQPAAWSIYSGTGGVR